MNLTAGVTIETGQVVTRQTLYDLWALASGGAVAANELSAGTFPMIVGSNPTSGIQPGQIWYDQTAMLWKVWVDVKDGTGVSVWLSWGPDRFDEVFIASEPMPPGSLFVLNASQAGRYAKRTTGFGDSHILGVVATNGTVQSGHWFAGAIEGFVEGWFPYKPASAVSDNQQISGASVNGSVFPIYWAPGGIGSSPSGNLAHQFIIGVSPTTFGVVTTVSNGNYLKTILFNGSRFTKGSGAT